MKRITHPVVFLLVSILTLGGVAYAGSGQPSALASSATPIVEMRAALDGIQQQIDLGLSTNGVIGAKIASSWETKAGAPTSITLSPMPSILNTYNAYLSRGFSNSCCYLHPILIKPTPSDATVMLAEPPTLKLVGGSGNAVDYANVEFDGGTGKWLLRAKRAGKVALTVKTTNNKSATKIIRITDQLIPVSSLSIYTSPLSLINFEKSSKRTLIIYRDGSQGHTMIGAKCSPSSASYGSSTFSLIQAVKFSSSNNAVASVASTSSFYGLINLNKPGSATITVAATDGGKAKATMKLTVKGAPVTHIELNDMGIQIGVTRKLQPVFTPANAWDQSLSWSSSNKKIATVDSNGYVKGISKGFANITCKNKASGKSATMVLYVGYSDSLTGGVHRRFYGFSSFTDINKNSNWAMSNTFTSTGISQAGHWLESPSRSELLGALRNIGAAVENDWDVTVVYFAWMSLWSSVKAERGALVCSDGFLTVDEVQSVLEQVPGTVVVILDCDLAGQYIQGKATQPAKAAQLMAFNRAWGDTLSKSKASNFSSKALGNSSCKGKFKVLSACSAVDPALADPASQFKWFSYWLSMGLGMTPNRATGALGTFSMNALRANTGNDDPKVITLDEIYRYVKAHMAQDSTPNRRETVTVWPANDKTAIMNFYDAP